MALLAALGGPAAVYGLRYSRGQVAQGRRQADVAETVMETGRIRLEAQVEAQRVTVGRDWRDRFRPHCPFRLPVTLRHLRGDAAREVGVAIDELTVTDRSGAVLFRRSGRLQVGLIPAGDTTLVDVPMLPAAAEVTGDPDRLLLHGRVLIEGRPPAPFRFISNRQDPFASDLVPDSPAV